MSHHVSSLRFVGRVALVLSLAFISASASGPRDATPPASPESIALESWQAHLQRIGWPQQLREQWAPRFLGTASESVANEFGGQTITFDGSRPGMLATVRLVLDVDGRPVVDPKVILADVLEAR
jgi:hypothetical protein